MSEAWLRPARRCVAELAIGERADQRKYDGAMSLLEALVAEAEARAAPASAVESALVERDPREWIGRRRTGDGVVFRLCRDAVEP
jgi:hypothetical protein